MSDAETLEAAILDNPHDPAPYLVYADWLQSRGDPRGELIVMQHRGVDASEYLAAHADALLGPLATFEDVKPKRGGYGRSLKLRWRNGFVEAIDISWGMYDRGGTRKDATEGLAAILQHPSCRFVTELELGMPPGDDICNFDILVDAIVAAGGPRALERLHMGDTGDWDISSTATGDFGAVAKVCKRLRSVTLRGGEVTIGEIDLPELRSFAVETGALGSGDLKQICEATWPNLETLEIWFGQTNYGASCTVDGLAPIFEARGLPNLKNLGIVNCPWVDDAIVPLAKSAVLRQLKTLDLSKGALSDAGVDRMVAHADAFKHLASIAIDDNALTEESLPKLRAFRPAIQDLGEQDPERVDEDGQIEDRYTAVGE